MIYSGANTDTTKQESESTGKMLRRLGKSATLAAAFTTLLSAQEARVSRPWDEHVPIRQQNTNTVITADDYTFYAFAMRSRAPVVVEIWSPKNEGATNYPSALYETSREYRNRVNFVVMNSDHSLETMKKFGITKTPAVFILKDSKLKAVYSGAIEKEGLKAFIERNAGTLALR